MTTQWHTFKDESDTRGLVATILKNFPHALVEVFDEDDRPVYGGDGYGLGDGGQPKRTIWPRAST